MSTVLAGTTDDKTDPIGSPTRQDNDGNHVQVSKRHEHEQSPPLIGKKDDDSNITMAEAAEMTTNTSERMTTMMNKMTSSRSSFTEAVPLSLSYMAHLSLPLEDGVMDGIRELTQHTMMACVNYARASSNHTKSTTATASTTAATTNRPKLQDLYVNDWLWSKQSPQNTKLPLALTKLGFQHSYVQQIQLCIGESSSSSKGPADSAPNKNNDDINDNNNNMQIHHSAIQDNTGIASQWWNDSCVMGMISFYYASEELFTHDELVHPRDDDDNANNPTMRSFSSDEGEDDLPIAILYNIVFEYRSVPSRQQPQLQQQNSSSSSTRTTSTTATTPSSSSMAIEAEELSMLSFGGSVDDALKYGALAALQDVHAKYVMDIWSVRGTKYRFDVMDATLSDGRVPRWKLDHPTMTPSFSKSLCVTTTTTAYSAAAVATATATHPTTKNTATTTTNTRTRLMLTLDGALRQPKECHPKLHYYTRKLEESFLIFGQEGIHFPTKYMSIMSHPSQQSLLIHPACAGHVYIDGRYRTTWTASSNCRTAPASTTNAAAIGTHASALFGMDISGVVPVWHNRIIDYETLKQAYATMWAEIMIDAKFMDLQLNKMLLYRLLFGKDEADLYDDYDDDDVGTGGGINQTDTSQDTLESQLMSSPKYDPVGICAKALGTTFYQEFGKTAYPCLLSDVQAVRQQLGHLIPVVVPQRLLCILRRGGYFDMARLVTELWFVSPTVRMATAPDETQWIQQAIALLVQAGIENVPLPEHVLFVSLTDDANPIQHFNTCRYHETLQQYYINDVWLKMIMLMNEKQQHEQRASFWIAWAIAKAHPSGTVECQWTEYQIMNAMLPR